MHFPAASFTRGKNPLFWKPFASSRLCERPSFNPLSVISVPQAQRVVKPVKSRLNPSLNRFHLNMIINRFTRNMLTYPRQQRKNNMQTERQKTIKQASPF